MTSDTANSEGVDLSALFSPQLEGHSQPWGATHLGLPYHGEVIVASKWADAWSQPLASGWFFRIVLLTTRQRTTSWDLKDSRIVVCVPDRDLLAQRQGVDRERRSIAEARGLYVTRRQTGGSDLRSSLEQRESELEGEFLQTCTLSYASGRIASAVGLHIEPGQVFRSPDPAHWLQALASAALAGTYPSPPVEHRAFDRPLRDDDLPHLFSGLVSEAGRPWSQAALGSFAVGLGLATRDNPSTVDPLHCAVFQLIRRELERPGPGVPFPVLAQSLGHSQGLPLSVVALFLLAFVKHAQPEVEVDLAPDNSLVTGNGAAFVGDRLTRDTVGMVRWSVELPLFLTRLHLPEPPTWNTALPFVRAVHPEAERASPQEVAASEASLISRLRGLADSARQAMESVDSLAGQNVGWDVESRLRSLVNLGSSADYREFYQRAREGFHGIDSLVAEGRLPARVDGLMAIFPEIAATRAYLGGLSLGPGQGALELDLQALQYETEPAHLLENPALWPAIQARYSRLKRAYADLYRHHHATYRRDSASLWARLQHSLPAVEALEQLNTIPELGPPAGSELPGRFEQLNVGIRWCDAQEEELPLEQSPICPHCGLRPSEALPSQRVEAFLVDLEQALREQNRRLSLHGIQGILARSGEDTVEKMIKIVRMADLGPLTNVLSPQVVQFLRTFLASG